MNAFATSGIDAPEEIQKRNWQRYISAFSAADLPKRYAA